MSDEKCSYSGLPKRDPTATCYICGRYKYQIGQDTLKCLRHQLTAARSEADTLRERVKEAEANAKLFAQLTINLGGALLCLSNCYWNSPKDRYGYGPELGCHPSMGKHTRHAWEAARSALDAMTTKKPDGEIQMHGDLYHKAVKVVGKYEPCYSKKALATPPSATSPGRKETT